MRSSTIIACAVSAGISGSALAQNAQSIQGNLNATNLCERLHLNNAQEGLLKAAIDKNYHTVWKIERNGDRLTFEGELACQPSPESALAKVFGAEKFRVSDKFSCSATISGRVASDVHCNVRGIVGELFGKLINLDELMKGVISNSI